MKILEKVGVMSYFQMKIILMNNWKICEEHKEVKIGSFIVRVRSELWIRIKTK